MLIREQQTTISMRDGNVVARAIFSSAPPNTCFGPNDSECPVGYYCDGNDLLGYLDSPMGGDPYANPYYACKPVPVSRTPTPTQTPSVTPSQSSPRPSASPSTTPSVTPSVTPSSSAPAPGASPSVTPTKTPSVTPSSSRPTSPVSPTPTPTNTPSVSPSRIVAGASPTPTPSTSRRLDVPVSPSPTPSISQQIQPSVTPSPSRQIQPPPPSPSPSSSPRAVIVDTASVEFVPSLRDALLFTYTRGSPTYPTAKTIAARNASNTKTFSVSLRSNPDILITPSSFTLAPQESKNFTVNVTPQLLAVLGDGNSTLQMDVEVREI